MSGSKSNFWAIACCWNHWVWKDDRWTEMKVSVGTVQPASHTPRPQHYGCSADSFHLTLHPETSKRRAPLLPSCMQATLRLHTLHTRRFALLTSITSSWYSRQNWTAFSLWRGVNLKSSAHLLCLTKSEVVLELWACTVSIPWEVISSHHLVSALWQPWLCLIFSKSHKDDFWTVTTIFSTLPALQQNGVPICRNSGNTVQVNTFADRFSLLKMSSAKT